MACILWSSALRVQDSQAHRKMDVTREWISCILELREILLSFQNDLEILAREEKATITTTTTTIPSTWEVVDKSGAWLKTGMWGRELGDDDQDPRHAPADRGQKSSRELPIGARARSNHAVITADGTQVGGHRKVVVSYPSWGIAPYR